MREYSEISNTQFETLARLWDELADFDASQTVDAKHHLMTILCRLIDAKNASWVAAVRTDVSPHDPLLGWRIAKVNYLHDDVVDQDVVNELKKRWEKREIDPVQLYLVRHSDAFHAFSLRKSMSAEWFESYSYQHLYAGRGIYDVLMVLFPLNEDTVSAFTFHRSPSRGVFGDDDISCVCHALRGLKWFHRRLMLNHGLLVASSALTPAERKVLQLLLTERSEKDIAQQLGIAVSTTHQYVTNIYRKYGVNGRAGLMSLWLNRVG